MATPRDIIGTATSVEEFIGIINAQPRHPERKIVYRGHEDLNWTLTPSINRPEWENLLNHEKESFRDVFSRHPKDFESDHSMFDKLVRLQHFGMPTRLLDVTSNPLVALYFATKNSTASLRQADGCVIRLSAPKDRQKYYDSDAVSCVANLSNLSTDEKRRILSLSAKNKTSFNATIPIDKLLQFIRIEKPHFRSAIDRIDLFKPYHVVPKLNNLRIVAQAGSFIIYGLPQNGISPTFKKSITGEAIVIPALYKQPMQKSLDGLGINTSTLFPEIESAARYVSEHYQSLVSG